jgi:hypothetical protein
MIAWEAENYMGQSAYGIEIWLDDPPRGETCGCGDCELFRRRHPGAAPAAAENEEVPF